MEIVMKMSRITALVSALLVVALSIPSTFASPNVFAGKSENQHQLSDWEQKKLYAEFENRFSAASSGAFQKLNNNPWAARKARDAHQEELVKASNSWGSCREYAYAQRGKCYSRGGDAYTCERYYDARVKHCDARF